MPSTSPAARDVYKRQDQHDAAEATADLFRYTGAFGRAAHDESVVEAGEDLFVHARMISFPFCFSSNKIFLIFLALSSSKPLNGSSNIKTSGFSINT